MYITGNYIEAVIKAMRTRPEQYIKASGLVDVRLGTCSEGVQFSISTPLLSFRAFLFPQLSTL